MHSENCLARLHAFRNEYEKKGAECPLVSATYGSVVEKRMNEDEDALRDHSDAFSADINSFFSVPGAAPFSTSTRVFPAHHAAKATNAVERCAYGGALKSIVGCSSEEAGPDSSPLSLFRSGSLHLHSRSVSIPTVDENEPADECRSLTVLPGYLPVSSSSPPSRSSSHYTINQGRKEGGMGMQEEEITTGKCFLVTSLPSGDRLIEGKSSDYSSSSDVGADSLSFSGDLLQVNKEGNMRDETEKHGLHSQNREKNESFFVLPQESCPSWPKKTFQDSSSHANVRSRKGNTSLNDASATYPSSAVNKNEVEAVRLETPPGIASEGPPIFVPSPEEFYLYLNENRRTNPKKHHFIRFPDDCDPEVTVEVPYALAVNLSNGFLGDNGVESNAVYKGSRIIPSTGKQEYLEFSGRLDNAKRNAESRDYPFTCREELERGLFAGEFFSRSADECYGIHDEEDTRKTQSWVERLGMHGENRVHSPPPSSYPFLMEFSPPSRPKRNATLRRAQPEGMRSRFSAAFSSHSSSLIATTGESTRRCHCNSYGKVRSALKQRDPNCRHSEILLSSEDYCYRAQARSLSPICEETIQACYDTSDSSSIRWIPESGRFNSQSLPEQRRSAPPALSVGSGSSPCHFCCLSHSDSHGYLCTVVPTCTSCGAVSSCSIATIPVSPNCDDDAIIGARTSLSLPCMGDDGRGHQGLDSSPIQVGISCPPSRPWSYSFRGHLSSDTSCCNVSLFHQRGISCSESFISHRSATQRALDPNEPPLDI